MHMHVTVLRFRLWRFDHCRGTGHALLCVNVAMVVVMFAGLAKHRNYSLNDFMPEIRQYTPTAAILQ